MARKPLTDKQKQLAKERMKKYWADKKGQEIVSPDLAVDPKSPEVTVNSKIRDEEEPVQKQLAMAEFSMDAAMKLLQPVRQKNPEVVECAQMVDALQESLNRLGQVRGLLS